MINVTRSYLPDLNTYQSIIKSIWQNNQLTNRGPLVVKLEKDICAKLHLENLLFVSNGTIALQLAIKALKIENEVITTPFSYVATSNALLWQGCKPVFCDIDPDTFCINADKIAACITKDTTAILATHVYGIPCAIEKIEAIAKKYNLKVIYDAAHAFGVKYKGQSILNYGDVSTCSFHATKLFHTVEGGSVTVKDKEIFKSILLYHSFGHVGDAYYTEGINAKNSEFHAAMGLCNLPMLDEFIFERKKRAEHYAELLNNTFITRPKLPEGTEYNFAYYPVSFKSEIELLKVKEGLFQNGINTRRYFFPSLNTLPFLDKYQSCPISEQISKCVLCLPMYHDLEIANIEKISKIINSFA